MLTFELNEIEEKDADDNDVDDKHSVDSFDDVKFTFGKVNKKSTLNGIRVTTVNLSTYFDDQKASLEIIVYLFHEPGSVKFGNETFAVQSGTVKFNIKVSNRAAYDFCYNKTYGSINVAIFYHFYNLNFLNYCFTVGKSVIYQCRRNHRARDGKTKI